MDDARARREILGPPDDAVIEAHADADDQVGVLHGQVRLHRAVHADHAQGLWVLLGEDAEAQERCADGQSAALDEAQ